MTKVTHTNKAFPDDHVFYVDGLPALPNGKAVELSDEDLENFKVRWDKTPEQQFKGNEAFTISGGKGGN